MNAVYGDLIAEIKRSDHPNPDGVVAVLRKSQRAWVAYREAYCGFRLEFSDPIVAGLMATSCECTLTRDKADHLSDD